MIKNGRVFAYGLHHPLNDFTGFFFFMMWNLTKAGCFSTHPWRKKPRIHNPSRQNHVSGNPGELLVGIGPRMSGSPAHPKPPTTRLYCDGFDFTGNILFHIIYFRTVSFNHNVCTQGD